MHERMLAMVPARQQTRLTRSATVDLDATDIEVYGVNKRGVAFNYQRQRCGRAHVATWAECETTLAADLLSGDDDPRPDEMDATNDTHPATHLRRHGQSGAA